MDRRGFERSHAAFNDLNTDDAQGVRGGSALPPIGPLRIPPLTWYYTDATPIWAIQNAIAAGYDVANIDDPPMVAK